MTQKGIQLTKKIEFLMGAIFLICAGVLCATVNDDSLWLDEIATVSVADPRWGILSIFRDANLPLTYSLVFISKLLFGTREFAFRFPFLLFSLLTLIVLNRLLRHLRLPPLLIAIAPLVLLLFPKYLYFSKECRAYMPMVFSYLLWIYMRRFDNPLKTGLASFLFLQSNIFSGFVYVGILFTDLFGAIFQKKGLAHLKKSTTISQACALLLQIPFLVIIYRVASERFIQNLNPDSRASDLTIQFIAERVFHHLVDSFTFFAPQNPILWLSLAVIGIASAAARDKELAKIYAGTFIGIFAQSLFLALSGWAMFERYLILGGFSLMIAPFFIRIRLLPVLIAALFLQHITFSPDFRSNDGVWPGFLTATFRKTADQLVKPQKENWRDLVTYILERNSPGQSLSVFDGEKLYDYPFKWYRERHLSAPDLIISTGRICADWMVTENDADFVESGCPGVKVFQTTGLKLFAKNKNHLILRR